MRSDICIPADPAIRVGRVRTHSSGRGFEIVADPRDPDSPVIDNHGQGFTVSEAQACLDDMEQWRQLQRKQ